jgi:hypothetical protein
METGLDLFAGSAHILAHQFVDHSVGEVAHIQPTMSAWY